MAGTELRKRHGGISPVKSKDRAQVRLLLFVIVIILFAIYACSSAEVSAKGRPEALTGKPRRIEKSAYPSTAAAVKETKRILRRVETRGSEAIQKD